MVKLPFYEIQDGIYEIDEFDCDDIFVIVGEKKALVIDAGTGIGRLTDTISRITDKPYEVVITHGHPDHIGGADCFSEVWLHPDDWFMINPEKCDKAPILSYRKNYADIIRNREKKFYDYNPETDMHEWERVPGLLPLRDGQRFDLGGRVVTAYHCPGHTPGEMVLIDEKTRTLILGDACNCNFLVNENWKETPVASVRATAEALVRVADMGGLYDHMYNSHHDFRGFGSELPRSVLLDCIQCMKEILDGTVRYEEILNPLSNSGEKKIIAIHGDSMVSFLAGDIRKECGKKEASQASDGIIK